ncbi:MAG TPA: response regulator [Stellaceae bacterium]|nr:response regulator [Stellaceae bacterium]
MTTTPIDVLLIEDSPGDVRLIQEAFRGANEAIRLHVTGDGEEAIAFLMHQGKYARDYAPRPHIILLDLNLPKVDGHEVLSFLKNDDALKMIPTVVLTSSDAQADILRSYELHANCFLKKPVKLEDFISLVQSINDFWLTNVRLPHKGWPSAR